MSDSSEDEDLSRFKEAVDTSFVKLIDQSRGKAVQCNSYDQPHSERYLDVASHYNDVKVPKEMQKHIGDKISSIIDKLVEYVDVENNNVKKRKIKGGVKLFRDSEGFLSSEEAKDIFTKAHNSLSRKMKISQKKRIIDNDMNETVDETGKIKETALSGEYILSKEETRHWKSRRKEKVFQYKATGKNKNVLISV